MALTMSLSLARSGIGRRRQPQPTKSVDDAQQYYEFAPEHVLAALSSVFNNLEDLWFVLDEAWVRVWVGCELGHRFSMGGVRFGLEFGFEVGFGFGFELAFEIEFRIEFG